jgi:DNA-directed RNA polymerase specialized sigma24 family protein
MVSRPTHFRDMDQENFRLAYEAFKGKIRTFARNAVHSIPGMEREDIEAELLIILARCVRDYDPNAGASFNTLTQGSFQRKIMDLRRKATTKGRTATLVYLDAEEVRIAINGMLTDGQTTEDIALAPYSLDEGTLDWIRKNLKMGQIEALGLLEVV